MPAIQPTVRKLYVFQREPGWVMPKGERTFTEAERQERWPAAGAVLWTRARLRYSLGEEPLGRGHFRPGTKLHEKRQQTCLDYISSSSHDRPDLQKAVTPTYPYPGKRPVIASTFYPALKEDNVELVPKAVAAVTPRASSTPTVWSEPSTSSSWPPDSRRRTTWPASVSPGGRGQTLEEHWAGEPRAYLGITVPGFPNFFMLYGPGTNGGEIVSMLEARPSTRCGR